jgi:hypothetical protein
VVERLSIKYEALSLPLSTTKNVIHGSPLATTYIYKHIKHYMMFGYDGYSFENDNFSRGDGNLTFSLFFFH